MQPLQAEQIRSYLADEKNFGDGAFLVIFPNHY
jgi:hypothetical protein